MIDEKSICQCSLCKYGFSHKTVTSIRTYMLTKISDHFCDPDPFPLSLKYKE